MLRDADVARRRGDDRPGARRCSSPTITTAASARCGRSATIAWMRGDLAKEEQVMHEALELARAGRAQGLRERGRRRARERLPRPARARPGAAADRAGDSARRGERQRRGARPGASLRRPAPPATAASSTTPRPRSRRRASYLAEAGAAWSLGRTLNFAAWTARHKGDLAKAERLFRESIRILAPLEDRATLCESQRCAGRAAAGRRAASTRPSASRSPRARPSARTTSPRSPRRRCRSASCARRRAATRRPRSCCAQAYDTIAGDRAPAAPVRAPCRRWLSSCATAAATTRPPSSTRAARASWRRSQHRLNRLSSTRGRATRRSRSPAARTSAAPR